MSVATFDDTMSEIILELNDREIYNDIRSQVDITHQQTIADALAEYANRTRHKTVFSFAPGESQTVVLGPTDFVVDVWLSVGARFMLNSGMIGENTPNIISSDKESITLEVTNTFAVRCWAYVYTTYRYLVRAGQFHTETRTETMLIRATNATSIAKYGRRVLVLNWPLGQIQTQMQSLIEAYLERFKEPVPKLEMRIQGRTDALIEQIFTRRVSEQITVKNTALGLTGAGDDFFINAVASEHDVHGLLECTWQLEQVRDMEKAVFFTLDTSLLDGPDILAW